MTKRAGQSTSVSALMGASVSDTSGRTVGHVLEFAVSPPVDASHVHGLVLRLAGADRSVRPSMVAVGDLELTSAGRLKLRGDAAPELMPEEDTFLLLERDLLDQQIIDVHGHKVVRVNDVDLVWEPAGDADSASPSNGSKASLAGQPLALRIAEVEVGTRGAIRRLLKGLPAPTVERVSGRFRTTVIPWDFVDLIDRDPARRVRLKIEQDRLAKMHPSDLADILEDLAPAERQAIFSSLNEEVAAEALEEVEPKMQKALTESLDSEQIAGIVEEMDPAAAADFLAELPDDRSEAILEEMDPEERQEVEELLEFSAKSAAGEMTTDYVSLRMDATAGEAVEALHDFEGDLETLTHIFLVDEQEVLRGVVPLVKVLLAPPESGLQGLAEGYHLVSCDVHASGKKVAELFDKYNLRALPVVDAEKKLAGVIYAEQVIAQLRTMS
ncbi:MAG: CBS domain-containing protein [Acidobacteriaceae bacterium]|jgi:CBS domain-containing protein/sporulation protein YlmC with PRC-barrel domain